MKKEVFFADYTIFVFNHFLERPAKMSNKTFFDPVESGIGIIQAGIEYPRWTIP